MVPLALGVLAITSCVTYDPQETTLQKVESEVRGRLGGRFTFETAAELACSQNPELKALEADARAAGMNVAPTEVQVPFDGAERRLAVMVDPLALLHLGQRGAAIAVADARAAEAVAALGVARWRTLAEIAEIFAVLAVLQKVEPPEIPVDSERFGQAGLASPSALAQVRAAVAGANAEKAALAADKATLCAELRRLLGLPPTAAIELEPVADSWPPTPAAMDLNVLRRPDLSLALARYSLADAEFRSAVADQYPSLMLGPEVMLSGGTLDVMAFLRLPIGASGAARSARERRSAARARLADELLRASGSAAVAEASHAAAQARATARVASSDASRSAFAVAMTATRVEVDAFERLADKALMAVREASERREAVMAAARARVRRAVAYGWPVTGKL